jgi:hypothetical protein
VPSLRRAALAFPVLLAGCSWALVHDVPDDAPDARALDDDPPCTTSFVVPLLDAWATGTLAFLGYAFAIETATCDEPACAATYAPLAVEATLGALAFWASALDGVDTTKSCDAWIYRVAHTPPEKWQP